VNMQMTSQTGPVDAIVLKDVRKSFDGEPVLKGINLKIIRNKITVLLGFSGSGKSTIMKIIIGLLHAEEGVVEVFEKDRNKMNKLEIQKMRTRFGMLFQASALFDDMSVFDNVAFPLREHNRTTNENDLKRQVVDSLSQVV